MFGPNFYISQRLSYLSPSKWTKKDIKEQLPNLFPFFANKGATSTQEHSSHKRVHHPLYIKKRKNQLLQNASFRIVKKNMITCFFFCFAHIAPVRHPPTPLSELILSQYLNLSCFPSKKASSYKSRRVPNYTMRERLCSPTCQGGVEDTMLFFFSNRKYEVISLYEEILS